MLDDKVKSHRKGVWICELLRGTLEKPEEEQTREFVKVFLETVWTVHGTALIPPFSVWEPRVIAQRMTVFRYSAF